MFSKDPVIASLQAFEIAEESWESIVEGEVDNESLQENIRLIGQIAERGGQNTSQTGYNFEGYEAALAAWEDGDYSEAREFFESIEGTVQHFVEDIEAEDLEVEKGEKLGEGLNDEIYELGEIRVLRVSDEEIEGFNQRERQKLTKLRFDRLPDHLNIPRVEEVGVHDGFSARIEERAPGRPLHEYDENYSDWSQRLETLANAPQKHYDKLIEDSQGLEEYGLSVDDSAADNIFYDEEEGFTIVDINHGGRPDSLNKPASFVTLATAVNYPENNDWQIEEDDLDNLCVIHHKLMKAGDPYSDDFDRRMARKSYPNTNMPEEKKPPVPEPNIGIDLDGSGYANEIEPDSFENVS
jgi:hypothetical protein